LFNNSDGLSCTNITIGFKKELKNLLWAYAIMLRTGREYNRFLYKGTFDVCNVQKGILGNIIVKYVKDVLDPNFSNYKFQCPQPAGLLYFYNFPTYDTKNIPRILVMGAREEWEFSATLRSKITGVKGMAHMLSSKMYGSILM
jgi:hypothetical protein